MATFPNIDFGSRRESLHDRLARSKSAETAKPEQPPVFYRDPKTGERISVTHPELTGLPPQGGQVLEPNTPVNVTIDGKVTNASFNDYLKMLGTRYEDYAAAEKEQAAGAELFRSLHRMGLAKRLEQAQAADRSIHESFRQHEESKVVRGEMEGFLVNLINDSGYGEAIPGSSPNDHHDKIDFFVKLDPHKIPGESGEPVYLGVQHTTLSEARADKLAQKRSVVEHHQERFIPEHPEYGIATRVMFADKRENYFPNNGQRSYDFIKKTLERKTNRKARAWEALRYDESGQPTKITETGARAEARGRVYELYKEALNSVTGYAQDTVPRFKPDLERKKTILAAMIAMMERENPELAKKNSA